MDAVRVGALWGGAAGGGRRQSRAKWRQKTEKPSQGAATGGRRGGGHGGGCGIDGCGCGCVGVWVCGGVLGSATEALLRQNRALLLRLVATAPGPGAEIGGSPRTGRWGRRSCRWVPWETAG